MSDIKNEPTPEEARKAKFDQEERAGAKASSENVNPRNGSTEATRADAEQVNPETLAWEAASNGPAND